VFAFLVGVDGLSDSSLNNRLYISFQKAKIVIFCDQCFFFFLGKVVQLAGVQKGESVKKRKHKKRGSIERKCQKKNKELILIPIGIYLICASCKWGINSYLPLDGVSIS
jgi:hypothetical protein